MSLRRAAGSEVNGGCFRSFCIWEGDTGEGEGDGKEKWERQDCGGRGYSKERREGKEEEEGRQEKAACRLTKAVKLEAVGIPSFPPLLALAASPPAHRFQCPDKGCPAGIPDLDTAVITGAEEHSSGGVPCHGVNRALMAGQLCCPFQAGDERDVGAGAAEEG